MVELIADNIKTPGPPTYLLRVEIGKGKWIGWQPRMQAGAHPLTTAEHPSTYFIRSWGSASHQQRSARLTPWYKCAVHALQAYRQQLGRWAVVSILLQLHIVRWASGDDLLQPNGNAVRCGPWLGETSWPSWDWVCSKFWSGGGLGQLHLVRKKLQRFVRRKRSCCTHDSLLAGVFFGA